MVEDRSGFDFAFDGWLKVEKETVVALSSFKVANRLKGMLEEPTDTKKPFSSVATHGCRSSWAPPALDGLRLLPPTTKPSPPLPSLLLRLRSSNAFSLLFWHSNPSKVSKSWERPAQKCSYRLSSKLFIAFWFQILNWQLTQGADFWRIARVVKTEVLFGENGPRNPEKQMVSFGPFWNLINVESLKKKAYFSF